MITRNKLQTKQNVYTKLIGTLIDSPKAKIKQETERNIKIEIKEEYSKPLSKKQKERRRRRNLREMENYEWDHVHYKSGKGILCCEHAKGNKKTTTDDRQSEHSTTESNKNNSTGHNQSVNTENILEITTSAEKEPTVNESNIDEIDDNSPEDGNECPVNTENTIKTTTEPEDGNERLVNTENTTETTTEPGVGNNYDSETDTEPSNIETNLAVNTENNKEPQDPDPTTYREKDAIDALLLLSGSEDTMDEFELTKDNTRQDNQIEFSHDPDMEGLMTALHIDSAPNNEAQSNTSTMTPASKQSSVKHTPKTTSPKPRQRQTAGVR